MINGTQSQDLIANLNAIGITAPREFNNHQNRMGFKFRKEYNSAVKQDYNNRTKYMYTGTGVNKTSLSSPLSQSRVVVYSNREINAKQEFGGIDRPKRGRHKPITQKLARRGRSENKPVGTRNQMRNIDFSNPVRAGNRAQRFARTIQQAGNRGERFAFLEYSSQSRGIYALKNRRKVGGIWRYKIEKYYDLSRSSVTIPAHHTMRNSFNEFKNRVYIPQTVQVMRRVFNW